MKHTYIEKIETMQVGGGMEVDFVHLKNGMVIGVNDECIVLYKDIEHFGDGQNEYGFIDIPEAGAKAVGRTK